MPKNSVFGKPQYSGSAPKTGFSVSQDFTFTASVGHLLPVYKKILYPGDKISGVPQFFLRTDPLVRPAMADVDVYVDVFFVPFRHIISTFEQWYMQIDDRNSDALSVTDSTSLGLPLLGKTESALSTNYQPFAWVTKDIFNKQTANTIYPTTLSVFGSGLHRLTSMLGYNPQSIFFHVNSADVDYSNVVPGSVGLLAEHFKSPLFCPYYYAAYQKIYYDYYRDTDFESNKVAAYNLDSIINSGSQTFYPELNGSGGFTDRFEMFRIRYRNRSKDYFTATHRNPLFSGIGMLSNSATNLRKMNNWLTSVGEDSTLYNNSVFVKSDFGNPTYELKGNNIDARTGWNGSYSFVSGEFAEGNTNAQFQFEDGEPTHLMAEDTQGYLQQSYHTHGINTVGFASNFDIDQDFPGYSNFSLANLRGAFAYDKLLRVTQMAGKHVDDQIFAHFGVKVPQGVSNEVYKLKSYHTMVHFGEVTSTAATADADLAEMAGRGVALLNGNDKFSFKASVPGIIMAIWSASPRYKYILGIEKDGFKTTLPDFFKPELDHLGMQPIFGYEYNNAPEYNSTIRGWQYRYMEDKCKFDKVTPVFATISKNPWSVVISPFHQNAAATATGNYPEWNKVSPFDLNNIFVVHYNQDGYLWPDNGEVPGDYAETNAVVAKNPVQYLSSYLTDPFTVDFSMKCTLVSQMSTFGEPSINGL